MVQDSAATNERWFFYQDVANLWRWARIDVFGTVLGYSGACFGARDECVADARRNGYRQEVVREPGLESRGVEHPRRGRATSNPSL